MAKNEDMSSTINKLQTAINVYPSAITAVICVTLTEKDLIDFSILQPQ